MSNINTNNDVFGNIERTIQSIGRGQRAIVIIPAKYAYEVYSEDGTMRTHNWDFLEEVQMSIRGPALPTDVFAVLRFSDDDTTQDVYVDIARF